MLGPLRVQNPVDLSVVGVGMARIGPLVLFRSASGVGEYITVTVDSGILICVLVGIYER